MRFIFWSVWYIVGIELMLVISVFLFENENNDSNIEVLWGLNILGKSGLWIMRFYVLLCYCCLWNLKVGVG